MRTKKEMFDLILNVAKSDDRIRAVLMTGSRANPTVPKDIYQDFDIIYFVKDVTPFYNNVTWIEEKFGKPSVMQMPEAMKLLPPDGDGHFVYLMIFEDGNRIDLSINLWNHDCEDGEPAVVLLDKDGILNYISEQPDASLWNVKKPGSTDFTNCCNEFWWCLNNVGKGIGRDELPYVMEMFNHYVRDMLNLMVQWHIGIETNFSVSAGKMGKYFKKYLSPDLYESYKKTYSNGDYENIWNAVQEACNLFRKLALHVAEHFHYEYNDEEEKNMVSYLNNIKQNLL